MRARFFWLFLFIVFLVEVGVYWQSYHLKNKIKDELVTLDNIAKDLEKLGRIIAEMDTVPENSPHSSPPTNGVKKSYHDGGHESAWIQDIDQNEGLVLVTTIDSKISIVFKPTADNLQKFHIGWIAPVTFQCTKVKKKKCDFSSPYKLFVGNGLVEVKQLKFLNK